MYILGIESSAVTASCAIYEDHKEIVSMRLNGGLKHSETLLPMIDDIIGYAGLKFDDISLIAVAVGPGSFTGLRIGVSTAKGLAFGRNIPCVAVSSLEGLAYNALSFKGVICCLMDARRNEFYTALFKSDGEALTRITEDEALPGEVIRERINSYSRDVLLLGDGAKLFKREFPTDKSFLAAENIIWQSASGVALKGYLDYKENKCLTGEEISPVYLRKSQAERESENK